MRVLVTGGGGFLGGAIVRRLLARGDQARSFSRGNYPELTAAGVEQYSGDLADATAVDHAVVGQELVFHVAAKPGVWGHKAEFYNANVVGTENILAACRRHGVKRLVYTSSPSVVHHGGDMEGVDESVPYPRHFEAHYPWTKALAEQRVLASNDATLATVALRPHLIWGPGDNHLVPRLLAKARAGKLRRVGHLDKRVDTIYIDNAADAHLNAADRLQVGSPIAGKAYFLAQGEPLPLWDLINRILACADLPPVQRSISPALAWIIGASCEAIFTLGRIQNEPPMTRFMARQLATAHWFDLSAARRDLGYSPRVDVTEGLRRLRAWLQPSPSEVRTEK